MLVSCEQPNPVPRTYTVSPSALVRIYRDRAGERIYTGEQVRIYLPEKDYKVQGQEIHWFAAPDTPAALVISTDRVLPNNNAALVVEGTCRGAVHDGKTRSFGVDYYVTIEGARITIRSP